MCLSDFKKLAKKFMLIISIVQIKKSVKEKVNFDIYCKIDNEDKQI